MHNVRTIFSFRFHNVFQRYLCHVNQDAFTPFIIECVCVEDNKPLQYLWASFNLFPDAIPLPSFLEDRASFTTEAVVAIGANAKLGIHMDLGSFHFGPFGWVDGLSVHSFSHFIASSPGGVLFKEGLYTCP